MVGGASSRSAGKKSDGRREHKKRHKKEEKDKRDRKRTKHAKSPERSVRREPNENRRSNLISDKRGGDEDIASASNEISLSIEETNKLRAQLGLAPLEVESKVKVEEYHDENDKTIEGKLFTIDGSQFVHLPAVSLTDKKQETAMREKLSEYQKRRMLLNKFGDLKPLGEQDEAEEESATSWVLKSRRLEEERRLAEKKARDYDEFDEQVSQSLESAGQQKTEKPSVSGLTVRHSKDEFLEGRDTILVLEDRDVLDEGEDVLVNPTIVEQEMWRKNVENRKRLPDYNPYENDEFDELGLLKEKAILKKYDEVLEGEKKSSFRLGEDGTASGASREEELAQLRQQLLKGAQSLESGPKQLAREYYTAEEMAKFKKPKKRVKRLRKKESASTVVEELAASAKVKSTDHGSRSKKANQVIKEEKEEGEMTEVDSKLSMANAVAEAIKINYGQSEEPPNLNDIVIVDEVEEELQTMLSLARKAKLAEQAVEQRKQTAEQVAEFLSATVKQEDVEHPSTSNLVFDSLSEYCRGLGGDLFNGSSGDDDTGRTKGLGGKMNDKNVNTAGTWVQAEFFNPPKKMSPSSDTSDVEHETTVLEEEPEASKSVAAALKLASQKGYLDKSNSGFDGVPKLSHLKAKRFQVVERQFNDADDKHTKKLERMGHHGGGGPITEFKEKRGYNPDVTLEYADQTGRLMDAKDAFRYLSWKFHGKKPGKKKLEKRAKRIMEAKLINQMSSTDTPLNTLQKQLDKQKQIKAPYIVLTGDAEANKDAL